MKHILTRLEQDSWSSIIIGNTVTNFIGPIDELPGDRRDPHHAGVIMGPAGPPLDGDAGARGDRTR